MHALVVSHTGNPVVRPPVVRPPSFGREEPVRALVRVGRPLAGFHGELRGEGRVPRGDEKPRRILPLIAIVVVDGRRATLRVHGNDLGGEQHATRLHRVVPRHDLRSRQGGHGGRPPPQRREVRIHRIEGEAVVEPRPQAVSESAGDLARVGPRHVERGEAVERRGVSRGSALGRAIEELLEVDNRRAAEETLVGGAAPHLK
mmetsp:Transcript_9899/g.19011  ORF Transcript_9899/g.19011 Transcript_9899/m.19011 type:complete len:202 (-) Transcript_9899:347-952(-)|eukprot:CAMPEP_0170169532 /NCGR_PEP_ID=MMETSP0040_2-20121228/2446_1 /TAXON_ID=641309 /ORGANISM="Lotharella oceanica, Strain CCMP622" /LENGTH=201 /DNA_ID=CAMNT_0010408329 /DNA_START=737 /DNA_END=1342 /DNA_ORIENTATION=-